MLALDVRRDIQLKMLLPEDARALARLVDSDRARLRQWLPWVDDSRTVGDSAAFIQSTLQAWSDEAVPTFGVAVRGKLAGCVGVQRLDAVNRAASIGYWLASEHEGRGIMTDSVRAVLADLFGRGRVHRVEIRAGTKNLRSCAIPERLGFVREGVARDAEWLYDHFHDLAVYSLLEPEWKRGAGAQ
jgi:ribosomal-protein-serine acetyltransferase